ncbi:MAG: hypothetical protein ACT6U0_10445 [Shinella sp.]|uniref:hypothetical protein n=1 Tax=Shinella sp. TaxID=1870904 RepID=UPI00403595F4
MKNSVSMNNGLVYAALLVGQTAAAALLFWMVFPVFYNVVTHLGESQSLDLSRHAAIAFSTALLHFCYWMRLNWVPVTAPFHSVIVSHLFSFASRISFFFGGALFSAIFFRHLPELDVFPPLGQAFAHVLYVMTILFALFCYSLDLERLAKAFEPPGTTDVG